LKIRAVALSKSFRALSILCCGAVIAGFETRRETSLHRSKLTFDHPVGATEQRERDSEAERLGGLEIDEQLDLGWPAIVLPGVRMNTPLAAC
jgi:hypothetical protein